MTDTEFGALLVSFPWAFVAWIIWRTRYELGWWDGKNEGYQDCLDDLESEDDLTGADEVLEDA